MKNLINKTFDSLEQLIEKSIRLTAYDYCWAIVNLVLPHVKKEYDGSYEDTWSDLSGNRLTHVKIDSLITSAKIYQDLLSKELAYKEILKCFYNMKLCQITPKLNALLQKENIEVML